MFIIIDGVTCYQGMLCTSTPITYNINILNFNKQAGVEAVEVTSKRRFTVFPCISFLVHFFRIGARNQKRVGNKNNLCV